MKRKEIITLVIAVLIIAVSIYFILQLLFPAQKKDEVTSEAETVNVVPSEIDENTLEKVQSLSDYGQPELTGIGKSDLFASF